VIETAQHPHRARSSVHKVLDNRSVGEAAFVLRLERCGLSFQAGQWINLGRRGSVERREYTVYSPPAADYIEVLVKEVEGGLVSTELRRCRPGDALAVDGPHGSFCIDPRSAAGRFLFIGTGTGVSPFHCFALSHPGLDYALLHGARSARQLYEHEVFDPRRFIACISGPDRQAIGAQVHAGRVTSFLREHPVEPTRLCYLCGNSDMIYECYAVLRQYGVPASRILAEVYF